MAYTAFANVVEFKSFKGSIVVKPVIWHMTIISAVKPSKESVLPGIQMSAWIVRNGASMGNEYCSSDAGREEWLRRMQGAHEAMLYVMTLGMWGQWKRSLILCKV